MSDGTIINGDAAAGGPMSAPELAAPHEALEYRLRRLEDAVAILQDTQMMEDRVTERVRLQMERAPAAPAGQRDAANLMLDAGLRLLPMLPRAAEAVAAPQATVVNPTTASPVAPVAVPLGYGTNKSWLFLDTINDLRVMMRVFTDPRYRITRVGWLVPMAVVAFVLCSNLKIFHVFFVWNLVPLLDGPIDKIIDLFVAFIGFKVMMREIERYRSMIPDAPGRKNA